MSAQQAPVLVVDDEYLVGEIARFFLEDAGYEVLVAPNGLAALEMARETAVSVVVTDFMMPKMTGVELAQAMKAEDGLAAVPIILVSGAQADIGRRHPELFVDVFEKPYTEDRLVEAVKAALTLARRPPPQG